MGLIEKVKEDIRQEYYPTQQEAMKEYVERMGRLKRKFISSMIDLVEKSVIDKRKSVSLPISRREDIPKLRHLIKRIAKDFGFKVKSVKKRWVIVEDTKFVVCMASKSKIKISDLIKK